MYGNELYLIRPIDRLHVLFGNPASLNTEYVIASTGFVNTTIIAFGECFAMSRVILFIILEFVATKSSRLIPGLRAIPAVINDNVRISSICVIRWFQ